MDAEKTILESNRLLIEVNRSGSELARVYDKKKGREILWNAKPEIWSRHAPLLFPFIGRCFENQYCYEGVAYPMTAHGFARDSQFQCVSANGSEVWYQLTDSEETYQNYPFHFKLETGHSLKDNQITVTWKVTNTDSKELLFMIGGHPAFRVPEGHTIYDFTFDFACKDPDKQKLHYEAPNQNGCVDPEKEGQLCLADGKVPLTKGMFDEVLTYIFDQAQVERASLLLPGGEPYVTLHTSGIPYMGVWTVEATHPFVCLEPWFGRCAEEGFQGELNNRTGIMRLGVGEGFEAHYVIEIH